MLAWTVLFFFLLGVYILTSLFVMILLCDSHVMVTSTTHNSPHQQLYNEVVAAFKVCLRYLLFVLVHVHRRRRRRRVVVVVITNARSRRR